MKKLLSVFLAVMLFFSFGFSVIAEETTMSVLYTLPTNMHTAQTSEKWIAVNQETVKVVFSEAVNAETLSGITFKDPQGNDPTGGVFITADGDTVTLKFGELSVDTVYTLTVPDTVESTQGNVSASYTDTFKTINRKQLTNVDFSDASAWPVGTMSPTAKGLFTALGYSQAGDLYQKLNSYSTSNNAMSITENGTLKIEAKAGNGNRYIGGQFRSSNRLTNVKVVTVMTFPEATYTNASGMGFGSLWTGSFGTASLSKGINDNGLTYSDFKSAKFGKNDNGFYDVTFVTTMEETGINGTKSKFADWVTAKDNLSDKTVSTVIGTKEDGGATTVYSNSATAIKIYYPGTVFEIGKLKQGFFTIPAPLSEATKDGKTLTYIVNTDIDVVNSTATVGEFPATLSYDATERKLTLSYLGALTEGQEYDVSFKNIVSADGIEGDVVVKYIATETDAYEATYSVFSNTYEVDSDALTITVPAGTNNQEFRANIIVDGDYVVKDADDTEIAEESDAILKEGTKVVLGNDAVYTVVLDFSTPFITTTKYEFITDGEVLEDEENVYDELNSIKVSFDVSDFTTIDGGSFSNVSIYETENPTNTVAISDSEFDANVLTLNIGGTLTTGKNYTLKLENIKDAEFGREYTFEKTFTVVETPQIFEVLYTIPNMLTTITNIGVNQEKIDIYFEEEIASGAEAITFKDSEGNAPIGGVEISAKKNVVTISFGELKESETYTLSVPDTLISDKGRTSVAKVINFTTLKKDLTDVDFSDTTVWTDGAYTSAQLLEKGLANKFTASKTTMTVADGALNVNMTANNEMFLGATHENLATSKVVSFIKFQKPTVTEGSTGQDFRIGGVWNGSLGSKFPAYIGATATFTFNEGASYTGNSILKSFKMDENNYYDITAISTLEEISVTEDLTTKTVDSKTVVRDNRSTVTSTYDNTDRQFLTSTTVRTKATAAIRLYYKNTFNVKSIKQGFYIEPKILRTTYDNDLKTISVLFNTGIDGNTLAGNVKLNGVAVNSSFDNETRILTVSLAKELELKDHTLTFDGVKSADGFKVAGSAIVKNSFEVSDVKFINKAGEIVDAFSEDTLKAQFKIKNNGVARDIDVVLANYNDNKLVGLNIENVYVDGEYTGEITLSDVYYNINGSACLMFWYGMNAVTDVYPINSDETRYVKIDYKDISLLNGETLLTPYNISGISSFDLEFTAANYSGESKDIVIEVSVNDGETKEIPVTVANGISKIKKSVSLSDAIATGDTIEISFNQGGEQLLKNAFTYTARAPYESEETDLSVYSDKRTVSVDETLKADGSYYEAEFEGTGLEVRANINGATMKVYVDGEYKETVELYASYIEGAKTAFMISGLSAGKHLIRLEKVGGDNLIIDELIVYTRDIRISCSGDSLTYGMGTNLNDKKYPAQLARLLGDGYEVGNFGNPGASIKEEYLGGTKYGYTTNYHAGSYPGYAESIAFLPDIVIIMLGTNDCRYSNKSLSEIASVPAAYKSLIASYQALSTNPQIYLNTVPAIADVTTVSNISNSNIEKSIKTVYEMGKATNNFVIDIFEDTIDLTDDYYSNDGLHMNENGYTVVANKVYNSLCVPKEEVSATVCDLKDGKTSLYTFTSDDGYIDAVQWFDKEFAEKGLKGTVVLINDYIDKTGNKADRGTVQEWQTLFDAGRFDLASHSSSHVNLAGEGITEEILEKEIADSKTNFKTLFPDQDVLFFGAAYNGVTDAVTKKAKENYYALRKGQNQFNTIDPTDDEWYEVKFQLLQSSTTLDTMNGWVDTAVSEGKWLMELWHGVEDDNYSPPTKANASAHFTYISEQKTMWSATVNEAIKYIKERQNSTVTKNELKSGELIMNVTDTLSDDIFDYPLSVEVKVPYGTKSVSVYQGKSYKKYSVSGTTAFVEIIPDKGYARIIAE